MLDTVQAGKLQAIEGIGNRLQVSVGQMQVDQSVFQAGVSEQDLDGTQIGSGVQQMGGATVPQGIVVLLMICIQRRSVIVIIPSMTQRLRSSAICGGRTLPFWW
jgi:hypothetical protein